MRRVLTLGRSAPALVVSLIAVTAVLHDGTPALRVSAGTVAVVARLVVFRMPTLVQLRVLVAGVAGVSGYASWWVWTNLPYGFLDARTDGSGVLLWTTFEVGGIAALGFTIARLGRENSPLLPIVLMAVAGFMAMRLVPGEALGVRLFIVGLCAAVVAMAAMLGWYLRALDRQQEFAVRDARRDQRRALAMDLHDFVAHEITAIAVEAQASRLVGADPTRASFERIENAAGRAMDSLDRSIAVLASQDGARLRHGSPGLADLADLVTRSPRNVEMVCSVDDTSKVPSPIQATAYRLAVEGLNNVQRHAAESDRVIITLSEAPGALMVTVWNGSPTSEEGAERDVAGARPGRLVRRRNRPGLGIVGLRERVESQGGTFEAGPEHGRRGWRLSARLPTGSTRA